MLLTAGIDLDAKHGVGKCGYDGSFHFDGICFGHRSFHQAFDQRVGADPVTENDGVLALPRYRLALGGLEYTQPGLDHKHPWASRSDGANYLHCTGIRLQSASGATNLTQFNTTDSLVSWRTDRRAKPLPCLILAAACMIPILTGCATPHLAKFDPQRYRIEVSLDPATHSIEGQVAIDMTRKGSASTGPAALELLLHPGLKITGVRGGGVEASLVAPGLPTPRSQIDRDPKESEPARSHWVQLGTSPEAMTLFVSYQGRLQQDIAAGEKAGEIHNFEMKAHIGEEGIYLADGYWYPQPAHPRSEPPPLSHFTLLASPVADMILVASGDEDELQDEQSGRHVWQSPYPIPQMILVGGRHTVQRATHNGVELAVHLSMANAGQAEGLIAAAKKNLDRYVPLMGPYPARQYTIVENFFSSGFAFPCFTLLSSAVIGMGERGWGRHGYLDHEFLHSWWGAGVQVDPRDGNWCESLASYGANYYGFVLDGDEEGARKKRRNIVHFLSRIKSDDDKPLGTYGQPGGCSRSIAYDKGAMVFHMLERLVGEDSFWTTMRQFNNRYLGMYASWTQIEDEFERSGHRDLDAFFRQWIRTSDAPLVSLNEDPDYHMFRKMEPEQILPTTASTRSGNAFTAVMPNGDVPEQLQNLAKMFESSFEKNEWRQKPAAQVKPDKDLAERCALILGEAVREPLIDAFLAAIEFPVRWMHAGFTFENQEFTEPGHSLLCTIRHPGVPGGGVTVFYGNSEEAIPRAELIPFYENSLIIFKDGIPILRRDFEPNAAQEPNARTSDSETRGNS